MCAYASWFGATFVGWVDLDSLVFGLVVVSFSVVGGDCIVLIIFAMFHAVACLKRLVTLYPIVKFGILGLINWYLGIDDLLIFRQCETSNGKAFLKLTHEHYANYCIGLL